MLFIVIPKNRPNDTRTDVIEGKDTFWFGLQEYQLLPNIVDDLLR